MSKYVLLVLIACFTNVFASVEVDQSTSAMIQSNPEAMWIQGTIHREIVDIMHNGGLEEGCPSTMRLESKWILTVDQQKIQDLVSYLQESVLLMHPDKKFEELETSHEYAILKTLSWHESSFFYYNEKALKWKDDFVWNIKIKNIVIDGDQWMLELDLDTTFNQIKKLYKLQPINLYNWPESIKYGDSCWRLLIGRHPDKYKTSPYPYIPIMKRCT